MLSKAHITSNNKTVSYQKSQTGQHRGIYNLNVNFLHNFVHVEVFLCGLHLYDKLFNDLIIKDDSSKSAGAGS